MKILIAIIIILILINYFVTSHLLNGNWMTTDDFSQKSNAQLFLNLTGHLYRSSKLIIVNQDTEPLIIEGHMIFIGSPHNLLFYKNCGIVITRGYEGVLPKLLYYKFDISGKLILYKDKIYGDFSKLGDF